MQNAKHIYITGEGDVPVMQHDKQSPGTVFPVEENAATGNGDEIERLPTSLLQEEKFFNRLLTRESSKGLSSRTYYRAAGKVPFQWEIVPGEPKNPSKTARILPLSPPPPVHRLHLSPQNRHHEKPRFWFLNSMGRKAEASRLGYGSRGRRDGQVISADIDDDEGDFASPRRVFRRSEAGLNACLPFNWSSVWGSPRSWKASPA